MLTKPGSQSPSSRSCIPLRLGSSIKKKPLSVKSSEEGEAKFLWVNDDSRVISSEARNLTLAERVGNSFPLARVRFILALRFSRNDRNITRIAGRQSNSFQNSSPPWYCENSSYSVCIGSARLAKSVYCPNQASLMSPTGPFRCFATIKSACPTTPISSACSFEW